MSYVPNTDDDRKVMLKKIGMDKIEDLFESIPSDLRLDRPLDIEKQSELELLIEFEQVLMKSEQNIVSFAGGGVYDHFIPAAVGAITSRPEFMTAYTPYQAEVAQGTLQVIYEFQSHICRLTGMDVANASMYDGATAAAEALLVAMNVTRRKKAIVSETVNPLYRQVLHTYLECHGMDLIIVPHKNGYTDFDEIEKLVDDKTTALLLGQPNFFGLLEEIDRAAEIIHKVNGKLILAVDPIAQALLKTPAEYDVDIVVGEGQPLGIPVSYGGPLVGFFAVKKELIRYIPGRIAARTKDVDGKEGFVLTLQTREQHIRREKATSNICTNQALCATTAAVYMSLMGKEGLKETALLSAEKAQKTAEKLFTIDGVSPYFDGPFVREFAVKVTAGAENVILTLVKNGLLPGINAGRWYNDLDDCLIIALTEKRTDSEINNLTSQIKELSNRAVLSSM